MEEARLCRLRCSTGKAREPAFEAGGVINTELARGDGTIEVLVGIPVLHDIEPTVGVGALLNTLVEEPELATDVGPKARDASSIRCEQAHRFSMNALPEGVRPVDKLSRVVEGEQSRRANAGLQRNRSGHRFSSRVGDGVRVVGGDA